MKSSVFVFLFLTLCCWNAHSKDEPKWDTTITIKRINNPKEIEGYWALSSKWMGFMGLALELRDGHFRYWFTSDVGSSGKPLKYPFTGEFTVENGILVLDTEQHVYDTQWLLVSYKGHTGLFPMGDFETITTRSESPDTRMLFRISSSAAKAEWPRYNAPK